MPPLGSPSSGLLPPTPDAAAEAWAARVRARREQAERVSELGDETDFYAPIAGRFAAGGGRGDATTDILLGMARAGDTWLDIGAGGGRYAVPLAAAIASLIAVEPSPAMRDVLREGVARSGVTNLTVREGTWPEEASAIGPVDVALMAHVGYETEDFATFLDAAESVATDRCVAVMRAGAGAAPGQVLWEPLYGEPRIAPPTLPQLLVLLVARGAMPEVRLVPRRPGYGSREELIAVARRQLRVRAGSARDRELAVIVDSQASEREGRWALAWSVTKDGVVSWAPRDSLVAAAG